MKYSGKLPLKPTGCTGSRKRNAETTKSFPWRPPRNEEFGAQVGILKADFVYPTNRTSKGKKKDDRNYKCYGCGNFRTARAHERKTG